MVEGTSPEATGPAAEEPAGAMVEGTSAPAPGPAAEEPAEAMVEGTSAEVVEGTSGEVVEGTSAGAPVPVAEEEPKPAAEEPGSAGTAGVAVGEESATAGTVGEPAGAGGGETAPAPVVEEAPAAAATVVEEPGPPTLVEEAPVAVEVAPPAEPPAGGIAAAVPPAAPGPGEAVAVATHSVQVLAPPGAPPAPTKPGGIGGFFRPPGGPRSLVIRIGILLVVLALLGVVVVGGLAVFKSKTQSPAAVTATDTSSPPPSPSASSGAAAESYFTYSDPTNQFSILRPNSWSARGLTSPDPNIVMVIGPTNSYPSGDLIAVTIHQLPFTLSPDQLAGFKDFIVGQLGTDLNMIQESPSPVIDGRVGYYFVWSNPKVNPTTVHAGYYLIDGDRFVNILLQIEPANDQVAFQNIVPIFQKVAQSLKSFHTPSPTSKPLTPSATSTPSP